MGSIKRVVAVNKPFRCRSRTLEGRREAWWMAFLLRRLLLERDVKESKVDVHDGFQDQMT